jgi:hypothetical protein
MKHAGAESVSGFTTYLSMKYISILLMNFELIVCLYFITFCYSIQFIIMIRIKHVNVYEFHIFKAIYILSVYLFFT